LYDCGRLLSATRRDIWVRPPTNPRREVRYLFPRTEAVEKGSGMPRKPTDTQEQWPIGVQFKEGQVSPPSVQETTRPGDVPATGKNP
jgi:hypothetical protein